MATILELEKALKQLEPYEAELIRKEAFEAKGLKAGEGFNPEATNKDLAALLASL